ncbi:MAG TPA: hypothetical protein VJ010_05405 [Actinomycetota bacterium]|nr:hypothetical protein [Actinomycetota bacterium]
MSGGYPYGLPDDELLALVELLGFVAELCQEEAQLITSALDRFVGTGYDASDLAEDVGQMADRLARSMGFRDASMEPAG